MRDYRLLLLALVHWSVDCYVMFIPPLWLALQHGFGMNPLQTGIVIAFVQLPANLGQPLFGVLSDRFDARWFIVAGPALLIVGVGLVGLSAHLLLSVLLLFVASAGSGMFHPEGMTLANRFGARGSGRAMTLFLGFGFAGQVCGPLWISRVISEPAGRFQDTWHTIPQGVIFVAIGVVAIVGVSAHAMVSGRGRRQPLFTLLTGRHKPVWCLIAMSVLRWCCILILLYVLPNYLGEQKTLGRWMALYGGAQGAGIILGGLTAPRHRERLVLVASLAAVMLPLWILPFTSGAGTAVTLAAVGLLIAWSIPTTISLGQAVVPGGERWISGMLVGFSWGIAAVIAGPLAGYLPNAFSTRVAFITAAACGTASLLLALAMPMQETLDRLGKRVVENSRTD